MNSIKNIFHEFQLTNVNLSLPFMSAEIKFEDADKKAAWNLYVELITRTTIQSLPDGSGSESSALESVYAIFPITRKILKKYGRKGQSFSKIALIVLNQILRPFTTKWHKISRNGMLQNREMAILFRKELADLQNDLRKFAGMLAKIAEVEDISFITEA